MSQQRAQIPAEEYWLYRGLVEATQSYLMAQGPEGEAVWKRMEKQVPNLVASLSLGLPPAEMTLPSHRNRAAVPFSIPLKIQGEQITLGPLTMKAGEQHRLSDSDLIRLMSALDAEAAQIQGSGAAQHVLIQASSSSPSAVVIQVVQAIAAESALSPLVAFYNPALERQVCQGVQTELGEVSQAPLVQLHPDGTALWTDSTGSSALDLAELPALRAQLSQTHPSQDSLRVQAAPDLPWQQVAQVLSELQFQTTEPSAEDHASWFPPMATFGQRFIGADDTSVWNPEPLLIFITLESLPSHAAQTP